MKERRKHKRFSVQKGVHAYSLEKVGKIHNVSLGGLLCNCLHGILCGPSEFDIFCPGGSVCLSGLPFKIVESKIAQESSSSIIKIRKCHVKFSALTHEKQNDLKAFINNYSLKEI